MYKHTSKESTFTSANCTPIQFIGQYTAQGGKYYQNSTTNLLIKVCERKQPTALKPRLYLVSKTIEGQFPFISSLYPQSKEDHYTAEINRKYFNVVMTEETINISDK
jgi:hypothetical protein